MRANHPVRLVRGDWFSATLASRHNSGPILHRLLLLLRRYCVDALHSAPHRGASRCQSYPSDRTTYLWAYRTGCRVVLVPFPAQASLDSLSLLTLLLVKLLQKILELQNVFIKRSANIIDDVTYEEDFLTVEHQNGSTRRDTHIRGLFEETMLRLHGYSPFTKKCF